jgi:glycerol uptake facilitator protein
MSFRKMPVYIGAQFAGAILAGLTLYMLFAPLIGAYENAHGIVRGSTESVKTAMMFGEYYPNPGATAIVSLPLAIGAEAFGTFLLVLMIFALTEGCNVGRPDDALAPVFVGLTVTSNLPHRAADSSRAEPRTRSWPLTRRLAHGMG